MAWLNTRLRCSVGLTLLCVSAALVGGCASPTRPPTAEEGFAPLPPEGVLSDGKANAKPSGSGAEKATQETNNEASAERDTAKKAQQKAIAEKQAAAEARQAELVRQKAAEQQSREDAALAALAAKKAAAEDQARQREKERLAAEKAQQKAIAEKQAAAEARQAEIVRRRAEEQKLREEALAQKAADQKAREDAALAALAAKKAAAEDQARQREKERLAAEKAQQKAIAEKQAAAEARQAELVRQKAAEQKAREEALAQKAADQKAREDAALAALAAKKAAAEEQARQQEQERLAAEKAQQKAVAEKQAEVERLRSEEQKADAGAVVSTADSEYVLQPGDEIDIQVYREPELSGTFRITPSGEIRHSLAGAIPMADKTLKEAEANFTARLAKDYLVNPRVIIKMVSTQTSQIVLLGEVEKPGVYPLTFGESVTLLQAIANAGGFTDLASRDRVRIVRRNADGTQTTLRIRVSELLGGKGNQQDIPLEPNDVINVPEVVF